MKLLCRPRSGYTDELRTELHPAGRTPWYYRFDIAAVKAIGNKMLLIQ